MPNAIGRAFSTANFLANLAALKTINFGSSDPPGVWFVVPNSSTNNIEIWVWQPTSMAATNEISVVRPDSVPPSSPGRCIQSLKFDAASLGGILAAIAALNTTGLIERTADGLASIVGLGAFGRTFLGSATDTAARTTLNLDNVTNTSDSSKPVSTAQQTALNLKADITALNLKANLASPAFTGIPTVPTATAGTNTTQSASTAFVSSAVVLLAPLASPAFTGVPTVPTAIAGTSTIQAASTAFVSSAVAPLAPLASPAFTGIPTVPTAAAGTNTNQAASTAFVSTALAAFINSAPAVLDTLGELATALGNNPNFATTITTSLAAKAALASPAFTGVPTVPTAAAGTSTIQAASTAFVSTAVAPLAPLVSPAFTGVPTVPTATAGTSTIQAASTAFVTTNFVALTGAQSVGGAKTFTAGVGGTSYRAGSGAIGAISMSQGGTLNAGYLEIYKGDGVSRMGYIGFDNTNFTYVAELGFHCFNGLGAVFNNTTNTTSTTTGGVIMNGGLAVAKDQYTGGFTSFGDNNVGLKCKVYTGTMSATQGGSVNIAHGLTGSKIVQVSGVIFYTTGSVVPIPGNQPGYQSYLATDITNINVTSVASNSGSIVGLPFTVTVWYRA